MIRRGQAVIDEFRGGQVTRETSASIRRLLESAIQSATYMVFGMAEQQPRYLGMGTTVSALLLTGAHCVTAQVGDTVTIVATRPLSKLKHFALVPPKRPGEGGIAT